MKIVYLTHSLVSDWNHGNAHFLRGVLSELQARGHETVALEPAKSWSRENLRAEAPEAETRFAEAFPDLVSRTYETPEDIDAFLDGADLVIVHEWTDPAVVAAMGERRRRGGRFLLLFHDTHHRAVSDPDALDRFDLECFDGVLVFGEAIAEVYRRRGWGRRVWTWHEAADTRRFRPLPNRRPEKDIVWIGNWGDNERTAELEEFLFAPAARAGASLDIYGVRYPEAARRRIAEAGGAYHGWAANVDAPDIFARHRMTVHVPRRFYARSLPGIPTIRVFEALACGIPLISAPWKDSEHLFRPGEDFLTARNGSEAESHIRLIREDPETARAFANSGLERIKARHTCAHRVDELLVIVAELQNRKQETAA